jgi:hypothetical protein
MSQSVQPEAMVLQVLTLFPPLHQMAPSEQASTQVAVQWSPEQTSCAPVQATGAPQSVQPELITAHVETFVSEHLVALSVH